MTFLIICTLFSAVVWTGKRLGKPIRDSLPTVEQLQAQQEADAYLSEGMNEVNRFLAPFTTDDEGKPIEPERPIWSGTCGCGAAANSPEDCLCDNGYHARKARLSKLPAPTRLPGPGRLRNTG